MINGSVSGLPEIDTDRIVWRHFWPPMSDSGSKELGSYLMTGTSFTVCKHSH